jgi:hypothetical protein
MHCAATAAGATIDGTRLSLPLRCRAARDAVSGEPDRRLRRSKGSRLCVFSIFLTRYLKKLHLFTRSMDAKLRYGSFAIVADICKKLSGPVTGG